MRRSLREAPKTSATPPPDAVRLFDDAGFSPLDRFALDPAEVACSLTSLTFAGDPTPYFAVGTAVTLPDEAEPTRGRILILQAAAAEEGGAAGGSGAGSRRLEAVAAREVKGAVYALVPFRGGLLAGVNARVSLYKWAAAGGRGGDGEDEDDEMGVAGAGDIGGHLGGVDLPGAGDGGDGAGIVGPVAAQLGHRPTLAIDDQQAGRAHGPRLAPGR